MTPTEIDQTAPVVSRQEIDIDAPLERVWDIHTAVDAWPQWQTDITAAHLDGHFEEGASFDWTSYDFPVTSTIYEIENHARILWGGTAGGITGVHEWLFIRTADGVHVATNESFSGAPVEEAAASLQQQLDASLVAWLGHLKAAAESG